MKIYPSEYEFENELSIIIDKVQKYGKAYYRKYLGKGIFEFVIYKGNEENYKAYYVALTLKNNEIKILYSKLHSWFHSENWGNEPIIRESKEEIMKNNIKYWIENSSRYWRMYSENKEYGIKLSDL